MTNPYARYTGLRARISEKEAELRELRTEAENEALNDTRTIPDGYSVEIRKGQV